MVERLKALRKALGLTQSELADALKIAQATVTAYETGNRPMTDRTIDAICKLYSVSERWLRTGEGDMFVPVSRDDEIAQFFAKLFSDAGDERLREIQRDFVSVISQLSADEWLLLADIAQKWTKKNGGD